jgi:LuxR family transcriptional regulator, maltose regulon positive regulatory protein
VTHPTPSPREPLLRTKLTPPPGRQDLIPRERLFSQFTSGIALPLTLVVAPAGSGKTSLLRSWRAAPQGRSTRLAWLALDPDDNGPIRFWRYVAAALETCMPGTLNQIEPYLRSGQQTAIEHAVTELINLLTLEDSACLLAIDDYHLITEQAIHDAMQFFIERLPSTTHVVLLTRADPPLPLARWRARGVLQEIRLRDLRFTPDEAWQLLQAEHLAPLSEEDAFRLNERAEGWAAGLHLAALALRGREDVSGFVGTFSGSHRFVLTYLIDEVLDNLPGDTQSFLLKTSMLDNLCGPLCDAITERQDGAALLEELEAGGFFITPLDDERHWYRYHHLFADVLRHRLQQSMPEHLSDLHNRAAHWYEQQGMIDQAIDHFSRAGSYDEAIRLIKTFARPHEAASGAETIDRWLRHIPADAMQSDPEIGIIRAWSRLVIGPIDQVKPILLEAEKVLDSVGRERRDELRGEIAAIRSMAASFAGDIERTIVEAEFALDALPAQNVEVRGIVSMALGQAHRFAGNLIDAEQAYREAIELGLQAANFYAAIDSAGDLGLVLMRLGRLHEAERVFQRARNELERHGAENDPVGASIDVIQPELLRERNDLDAAQAMVERGIALGHRASKMDILITGYRGLGTIRWAREQWDEAFAALDTAKSLASEYGLAHTARGIELIELQMHLALGDVTEAAAWLQRFHPDEELPGSVREAELLLYARALIATGAADESISVLDRLRDRANAEQRTGDLIRILAVQAIAQDALGNGDAALETLRAALDLARAEGFVRVFLDESTAMIDLLRRVPASGTPHTYAGVLLDASGVDSGERPAVAPVAREYPVELLTDREQAVLRLLKGRLPVPEIARELYVAPSTVRSHLKSIYRKLDVHSRDQAIQRARELDL